MATALQRDPYTGRRCTEVQVGAGTMLVSAWTAAEGIAIDVQSGGTELLFRGTRPDILRLASALLAGLAFETEANRHAAQ